MPSVIYRHEVPFGHRLMFHEGKCRFPHGHNYLFDVAVGSDSLDQNGMVIDFSILKRVVREFFEPFDHAFVLHKDDPFGLVLRQLSDKQGLLWTDETPNLCLPTKVVLLNAHPTAENLALFASRHIGLALSTTKHSVMVTCFEQRDCSAMAMFLGNDALPSESVNIVEVW